MAVFTPGVAQSKFTGTTYGIPFALIWHWRFGTSTAAWNATDLTTLANTLFNSFNTRLKAFFPTTVSFQSVQTVDLTNATPATGASTGAAYAGGSTSNFTANVCILINFHIAARYRGGHPRTYLPTPYAAASSDGRTVTPSAVTSYQNGFVGMVGDVVTALPGSGGGAANHCVPLYGYTYTDVPTKKKYLKQKTSLLQTVTVSSYSTHPVLASQRRRLQTA
jgi:hypothetical protein